jgi:hypothetical protein
MDKAIAAAAIARLEAEKQRRIAEKIAKGEAVLRPWGADAIVTDVLQPEAEEPKWPARDADGREIYYSVIERDANGRECEVYDDRPLVIVTGVPRAARDDDAYEDAPIAKEDKAPRIEDFDARRRVSQALHAVDRPLPGTPAPASVEEPAEPLVEHRIRVQVAPPTDTDPGAIVEGSYTLEDDVVRVYDVDQNLLGTEHLAPGADAGAAARRVLREKKGPEPFWNPIPYA